MIGQLHIYYFPIGEWLLRIQIMTDQSTTKNA